VSNPNITARFGIRLRQLREKRGWTQVVMADTVGIDRNYISDIERGKKNVCLATLEVLALASGVTHRGGELQKSCSNAKKTLSIRSAGGLWSLTDQPR
jgi:transcriptional regulator with XRE-family HTH domain